MNRWDIQKMLIGAGALLLFVAAIWMLTPGVVQAQCGDTPESSSCYRCHQEQAAYPVYGMGAWHDIHAAKDCCWNCHGGNTQSDDADLAHAGMLTNPLADIYTDCYACHPNDYQERAARFAVLLGVTPESRPTPTPHPAALAIEQPLVLQPPPVDLQGNEPPWVGLMAGLFILAFFLALLFLLARMNMKNGNQSIHPANGTQ